MMEYEKIIEEQNLHVDENTSHANKMAIQIDESKTRMLKKDEMILKKNEKLKYAY